MDTLTLENIKSQYYTDLALTGESRGFDQYLKEEYTQVYDINCNFVGYSKGVIKPCEA